MNRPEPGVPPRSESVLGLIGRTPLVRLSRSAPEGGAEVWGKVEGSNPGGSVKDRICLAMVEEAESQGLLKPGFSTIFEATSGNTGIGLAMVACARDYRCVLTMPRDMSVERRHILESYGARIILTDPDEGMRGAMARAEAEAGQTQGAWLPRQFENPANPDCHFRTTGPEIWAQMEGRVDALVAGVGTGGTLTGVGRFLRSQNPKVQVIAVEPASSAVLSGREAKTHGIQGIGAGFVPKVLDRSVIHRIIPVADPHAFSTSDQVARKDGLFVGLSAGAACWVAFQVAREMGPGARIAVILPDGGMKYVLA